MIHINGVNGQIGKTLYTALKMKFPEHIRRVSHTKKPGDLFYDLTNPDRSFNKYFTKDDVFIFLASYCNYNLCESNKDFAYKINVTGTEYLINTLIDKGCKVLFFSSAAVYGNSQSPLSEDDSLSGKRVYAMTKKHIEKKFNHNPLVKILRPSLVITKNDTFIQYIRKCFFDKKEAEIFSGILMTPIGITDIVNIIIKIMDNWEITPDVLNLCGMEHLYKEDIARLYKEYVNPSFCYKVVAPTDDYLRGRDISLPLSVDKLLAFYGKKLTSIKDVVIKDYA